METKTSNKTKERCAEKTLSLGRRIGFSARYDNAAAQLIKGRVDPELQPLTGVRNPGKGDDTTFGHAQRRRPKAAPAAICEQALCCPGPLCAGGEGRVDGIGRTVERKQDDGQGDGQGQQEERRTGGPRVS